LSSFVIFAIRAIIGILCAILVMRLFHPDAGMVTIMIVAVVLVGLAYIFEGFRKRKREPQRRAED
jgi:multisubunit Na+/H+ antiporter MnhB subunit